MNAVPPPADHSAGDDLSYNDPTHLAQSAADAPRPLLIGLDIDGVLSPLVDHADDARLLDGMADAIGRLAALDGVTVAAVSGRALASMRTFGLPGHVQLVGSHGMEAADTPMRALTESERLRLDELSRLANNAAAAAGDGAWVETKSASVAVHVRTADPDAARKALAELGAQIGRVNGASSKPGSNVLELFARHASKGTALQELRVASGASTVVFAGDDVTDEEAFAILHAGDISIKVGGAPTIASYRLRDPHDVLRWLVAFGSAASAPTKRDR